MAAATSSPSARSSAALRLVSGSTGRPRSSISPPPAAPGAGGGAAGGGGPVGVARAADLAEDLLRLVADHRHDAVGGELGAAAAPGFDVGADAQPSAFGAPRSCAPGDAGDAAPLGRAAAGRAIRGALGRGGGDLGEQRRHPLEVDDPPSERALGAHLLARRERREQRAVTLREPLHAGVRGGDEIPFVLALLGQVDLQRDVGDLGLELLQGGGVHGRSISHARRQTAMGDRGRLPDRR